MVRAMTMALAIFSGPEAAIVIDITNAFARLVGIAPLPRASISSRPASTVKMAFNESRDLQREIEGQNSHSGPD
jgi:hypothetical protein